MISYQNIFLASTQRKLTSVCYRACVNVVIIGCSLHC